MLKLDGADLCLSFRHEPQLWQRGIPWRHRNAHILQLGRPERAQSVHQEGKSWSCVPLLSLLQGREPCSALWDLAAVAVAPQEHAVGLLWVPLIAGLCHPDGPAPGDSRHCCFLHLLVGLCVAVVFFPVCDLHYLLFWVIFYLDM